MEGTGEEGRVGGGRKRGTGDEGRVGGGRKRETAAKLLL